jgi:hypothetical protein
MAGVARLDLRVNMGCSWRCGTYQRGGPQRSETHLWLARGISAVGFPRARVGPQCGNRSLYSVTIQPRAIVSETPRNYPRPRRYLAGLAALASQLSCGRPPRVTRQNGASVALRLCRCAPPSNQRSVAFHAGQRHPACRVPDTLHGSSTSAPLPQCGMGQRELI